MPVINIEKWNRLKKSISLRIVMMTLEPATCVRCPRGSSHASRRARHTAAKVSAVKSIRDMKSKAAYFLVPFSLPAS